MTPREKIMLDGLKAIAGSTHNNELDRIFARDVLKRADKAKDGPSEEDREELEGIIYTLDTDGVCGRHDARWMADKLKGIWG